MKRSPQQLIGHALAPTIIFASLLLMLKPTPAAALWNPFTAAADAIVGGAAEVFAFIMELIASAIGLFIMVAASIFSVIFTLNIEVLESPVIGEGFVILRDLVNASFVLVLLMIAFGTILRIQDYEMKRLLWKLIVAAILVNFSLTIAGVFIHFSNTLAGLFYEGAGAVAGGWGPGAGAALAAGIMDGFDPQGLFAMNDSGVSGITDVLMAHMSSTISALFAVIMSTLLLIVMLTLSLVFLYRYVALVILLVLSPLVWLFWTIPNMSHLARRWWNEFLRWVFFAPASIFFIMLSLQLATSTHITDTISSARSTSSGAGNNLLSTLNDGGNMLMTPNPVETAVGFFVVGALLIASLMVADKMGVHAAQGGIRLAKGAAMKLSGGNLAINAGKGAAAGVSGAAQRRADSLAARASQRTSEATAKAAEKASQSKLGRWTGAAAITRGVASATGRKGKEKGKETVDYYKKQFDGVPDEVIRSQMHSSALRDPAKTAALAMEARKRGIAFKEGGTGDDISDELLKQAKKVGMEDEIYKARPDLMRDLNARMAFTRSQIRPHEAHEIDTNALKDPYVVSQLTTGALSTIASKGTVEQQQAIEQARARALGLTAQIKTKIGDRAGMKELAQKELGLDDENVRKLLDIKEGEAVSDDRYHAAAQQLLDDLENGLKRQQKFLEKSDAYNVEKQDKGDKGDDWRNPPESYIQ